MYLRSVRNIFFILGLAILSTMIVVITTLFLSPTSSPSSEAQRALMYVSQRENIPIENLLVANEFPRTMPLLGRSFQAVTVLDRIGGSFFQVMVDRNSKQVEDWAVIKADHERAYAARNGKLQPDLYDRLQQLQDTDVVTVTIVVAAGPGQSLQERQTAAYAALAAKYPEARAAMERGGKPMSVADPVLMRQIEVEYQTLMRASITQRIQPLVQTLQAQGFVVKTNASLPAVTAELPKQVIEMLATRADVGTIFLVQAVEH